MQSAVPHVPLTRGVIAGGRDVVVAASSAITRWGLRAFIDHDDGLRLVAECASLQEVAEAAKSVEADAPVLLLGSSVATPGELLRQLTAEYIVVVFIETADVATGVLLRAGVRGLVDHRDDVTAVTATVAAACSGITAVDPRSIERLLSEQASRPAATASAPPNCLTRLSRREQDVLACLAQGWSNRQIGDHLHLTEGTVKGYVSMILSKLGMSNRTSVALQARSWGLPLVSSS